MNARHKYRNIGLTYIMFHECRSKIMRISTGSRSPYRSCSEKSATRYMSPPFRGNSGEGRERDERSGERENCPRPIRLDNSPIDVADSRRKSLPPASPLEGSHSNPTEAANQNLKSVSDGANTSRDAATQKLPNNTDITKEKDLSDDILNIIGNRLAEKRVLAPAIHSDFAVRWSEILNLGLPTDEREALIKKYSPPENCTFLDPPKLNPEVDRALNEIARSRDKRIVAKQNKLVACISGIGQSISTLLAGDTLNVVPIIECLSNVSRLMIDTLHDETTIRRSLVLANVNTSLKETLCSTTADDCLFGNKLSEELKAAKLITVCRGVEIKKDSTT